MSLAQKFLIWIARLISLAAATFFILFAIGEGGLKALVSSGQGWVGGVLFILFLLFAIVSTGIAFWRVRVGAYSLLISGLCLAVFAFIIAVRNNLLIAIVMGGPFILSAILLYWATIEKRSREIIKVDSQNEEQEKLFQGE